ncbi:hypothetical protein BST81_04200 [Leptolyngbya sp. 'hensonii']|uniref:hypothetical protein n=1 Tax=Leptolyngbya sp. 'hensonii' TaxID=1922337 RepID=UPI00094F7723|nr:hypothetical protein [Leptolyngbya sp. 'hensonii']OLP19742.1 hypothetical protein BST81_04200 [Leptolyngbya sp. 'hensonii']
MKLQVVSMVPLSQQTTYELWRSKDGSYDFFPTSNQTARALLDVEAELIQTFEAESWEAARQKQYEFLGWGNYHPDSDP